ncbi:50S ribosomal protein L37ae [Candidatus Woesearchaeota archaeon CG08_land_8_20_14_0_20_47_9]|nr:MAG: 50S ribosomal protein L37ae [Candidatus Woesearchaeota archaeon CG1_02_47_18]PIO03581.1 MAG: 50S ribosomal protein L37ae [Candidatus Woesearchaeota archaeon CG08_land_8_20_14_0_20_47_9]HII29839.1 50S ribosomal protein L37ae [Candidatus Woesearchaeota archaeon]
MANVKILASVKRFGPRYGRKVRYKVGKIESERREQKTCPYCHKERVKRIAAGIWQCKKCNSKFTGRAYTPTQVKLETTQGEATDNTKKPAEKEAVSDG